jgi:hypothetical protein
MHYRQLLNKHILPSLGSLALREIRPETIDAGRRSGSPRAMAVSRFAMRSPSSERSSSVRSRTARSRRTLREPSARPRRTVRVLQPLAADLREWRLRSGRPSESSLIFPSAAGTPWTLAAYQSWRRRAFERATQAAGLEHGRPYDLRHSFASLLLHEGRSVIYVARQLGHDARLTLSTYGHVMDEFEDTPRLDAQTAIADARAALDAAASSS